MLLDCEVVEKRVVVPVELGTPEAPEEEEVELLVAAVELAMTLSCP